MSREEKAPQINFIFSNKNKKEELQTGWGLQSFHAFCWRFINVVALRVHDDVLPLEVWWGENVRLIHRRGNLDLRVLVPAKGQIQAIKQWLVD